MRLQVRVSDELQKSQVSNTSKKMQSGLRGTINQHPSMIKTSLRRAKRTKMTRTTTVVTTQATRTTEKTTVRTLVIQSIVLRSQVAWLRLAVSRTRSSVTMVSLTDSIPTERRRPKTSGNAWRLAQPILVVKEPISMMMALMRDVS